MQSGTATRNLLRRAHAAHQEGKLSEAESGYRSVLRIRPEDPDALHFLGMLHFQRGERSEAIQLVRRSLASLGSNPHAWNNLGNMLLACDQPQEAADAYEKATQYGAQMAEAWYNRAVCLRRARQYDLAIDCFLKTIELKPQYAPVYERLGSMLYSLGRFRDAADVYRKWLVQDPGNPVARHMLSALSGEDVPARADDEYLRVLFDRFAGSFDENLQELGYRAPELLAATLGEYVATDGRLEILDAGCGTGLCAPHLRPFAAQLVGVDLSANMLAEAARTGAYDRLERAELCDFLARSAGEFDAINAADVLVYFGDLAPLFHAAASALRPNGLFAFSVEEGAGASFELRGSGRYAHSRACLAELAATNGFDCLHLSPQALRRDREGEVAGLVVVLRRA